jgi:hypothetical protein
MLAMATATYRFNFEGIRYDLTIAYYYSFPHLPNPVVNGVVSPTIVTLLIMIDFRPLQLLSLGGKA